MNLWLRYGQDIALRGVDIDLKPGELVAIVGPSGSGKSSLLHCLAGTIRPSEGLVRFDGRRIDDLPDEELSILRRRSFGFVLQFGALVTELSLLENVGLPLRFDGIARRRAEARAQAALAALDIDELGARRPSEVSGGQLQRAAVARAVVTEPAVVFADEATGALDSEAAARVRDLLIAEVRRRGACLVAVTHDPSVAAGCDRILEIHDGLIKVNGK